MLNARIGIKKAVCPFWVDRTFIRYCYAHPGDIMIPNIDEEQDYCRCDGFWQCPIYRSRQRFFILSRRSRFRGRWAYC